MMGTRVLKRWLEQEGLDLFAARSEAALEGEPDVVDVAAGEVGQGKWRNHKGGMHSILIYI